MWRVYADLVVELPFGGIEELDRLWGRLELLLYADTAGLSRDLRVRHARIFVDLAEQVLAVDQLQSPPPERLEVDAQPLKLLLLKVRHQSDQLWLVQAARIDKTFAQAVACAGPGTTKSISLKSVSSL